MSRFVVENHEISIYLKFSDRRKILCRIPYHVIHIRNTRDYLARISTIPWCIMSIFVNYISHNSKLSRSFRPQKNSMKSIPTSIKAACYRTPIPKQRYEHFPYRQFPNSLSISLKHSSMIFPCAQT